MPAIKQEANTPLVLTIGVISGLLIVVIIIGLQAWFESQEEAIVTEKYDDYTNKALVDLKSSQTQNISEYRWMDQKNNVVAIPIEKAMEIFVQTQGNLPTTRPTGL